MAAMKGHFASQLALGLAFGLSLAWFVLLTAVAMLMSTGLADEPGNTNGAARFFGFFAAALPGAVGAVLSVLGLKRTVARARTTNGFPVCVVSPASTGESGPTNSPP